MAPLIPELFDESAAFYVLVLPDSESHVFLITFRFFDQPIDSAAYRLGARDLLPLAQAGECPQLLIR
jgi:hypothetical protein